MKKTLILLGLAAVIGVMVVVGVRQGTRKGTKVYEEEAKTVAELVSTVRASGEIQPKVYVNISSQVPGQIVELRVQEGDRVRQGDILLQLDPEQYRSTVARLEAQLRLSRINLEREKNSLATYDSTLRRQEALAKSQIVSAEALDQSRLLAESSRIQVRALEEQIQQAQADLIKARDELSKTTIRAPIDGLVTRVAAKLGEQVIIGTMNNPGTVILVLSDMSELLAEVKVDETEVTAVRAGQRSLVNVDAVQDLRFEGSVSEIAHTAIKERDVSRFPVKVILTGVAGSGPSPATRELPLPEQDEGAPALASLRPGMSAHAAIQVASKKNALVVPIQAVVTRTRKEIEDARREAGGATSRGLAAEEPEPQEAPPGATGADGGNGQDEEVDLLFVDRDGKAEMIEVKTGLSDEFFVEILNAPLQAGDKVVVGPYRTLKKLKPGEAIVKVEKDEDLKEND